MDTSDSECFESADEDFDIEDKTVKTKPVLENVKDNVQVAKIEELTIHDVSSKESRPANTHVKVKPKKETTDKSEKGNNKPTRFKLGTRLGTKITNNPVPAVCNNTESNKSRIDCGKLEESSQSFEKDNDGDEKEYVSTTIKDIKNEENLLKLDKKVEDDGEVNMWADDEGWEPIATTRKEELQSSNKTNENSDFNSRWGSWGSWNVTSLLSTATTSVTTITNHVSQGLTTVLESGMGVPDPEELARLHKMDREAVKEDSSSSDLKVISEERENKNGRSGVPDLTSLGLGSFVSSMSQITKLVETTSSKVITSGLDTLETIGKKTMEVLQEGDPGLKKKRAFLKIDSNKPVLSHILREAKEKAEQENKLAEERQVSRKANYETLFDDHQGLAHLEALEMLSRQCDIKLKTLLESQSGAELIEMQETMGQIKELCEITDEEEDEKEELDESEIKEKLDTALNELNISISYSKLLSTWKDIDEWLEDLDLNIYNATQLHEESINILAKLTAVAVESFHKTGELLLIKEHRSTVDEADSLVQLTTTMMTLISNVAKKASTRLNENMSLSTNKDNINEFITNIYFEATNSSSYIKNAFELLIPVLQVGAV